MRSCIIVTQREAIPKMDDVLQFVMGGKEQSDCVIPIQSANLESVLLAIFKRPQSILSYTFHAKKKILYVVSIENPFEEFWIKSTKNAAFRALVELTSILLKEDRPLTVEECSKIRFFKRNCHTWGKWYSWYTFVYNMISSKFKMAVGCNPSNHTGTLLAKMLWRSQKELQTNVPADFYKCEITLDETVPVGVAFSVNVNVTYVSPMIVSCVNQAFQDVNRFQCEYWLPLYKNKEAWINHGLKIYASNFTTGRKHLKQIINLVSRHTSEKYKFIHQDLKNIAWILHV